jgi:hypothetical protein
MTKEKVEEIRARYNAIESMDPAATIDYIEFAKQAHRDRLDLLRYIDSLHAEPREDPQWTKEQIAESLKRPHAHIWSGIGPEAYCLGCLVKRGSGEL